MKKPAADLTIEKLINNGWKISHSALVSRYCFAGAVTPMKKRNGKEYCRVHHGKSVKGRYQITTVMERQEGAKA